MQLLREQGAELAYHDELVGADGDGLRPNGGGRRLRCDRDATRARPRERAAERRSWSTSAGDARIEHRTSCGGDGSGSSASDIGDRTSRAIRRLPRPELLALRRVRGGARALGAAFPSARHNQLDDLFDDSLSRGGATRATTRARTECSRREACLWRSRWTVRLRFRRVEWRASDGIWGGPCSSTRASRSQRVGELGESAT